jgi:transcriptional regulator with XRE-family HTH domain
MELALQFRLLFSGSPEMALQVDSRWSNLYGMSDAKGPNPEQADLGRRIRLAAKQRGYSQEKLAAAMDPPITQVMMGERWRGETAVKINELVQISKILDVPLLWFFGLEAEDLPPERSEAERVLLRIARRIGYERVADIVGAAWEQAERDRKAAAERELTEADVPPPSKGSGKARR